MTRQSRKINPHLPPLSSTPTHSVFSSSISPIGSFFLQSYVIASIPELHFSLTSYTGEIFIPLDVVPATNRKSKPTFFSTPPVPRSLSFDMNTSKYIYSLTMHKIALALPAILSSPTAE